ncbi:MAG: hypothetical protein KF791_09650 [Verrucomicrobiae bacterium]|nr:hypothetical protein [Verrucomicrobiae bacterium]
MRSSSSLAFLAASVALADPSEAIRRAELDHEAVIRVPVATNRVTTISFPGPIAAIDAAGVSADPKVPGAFQLAHTKGSSFLSVRAMTRHGAGNVNIRWNRRTYVLELVETNVPILALNLEAPVLPMVPEPAPMVSPTRLLAMLDKAKAFPLLKQQHPDAVAQVDVRTFPDAEAVTDFSDYEIQIVEVFRFNVEDTLIFHVRLRNKSDLEIRYQPGSFAVRVGDRLYPQSISDAPGVLPARSETTVYFAVTGTPDGGRNELSLKNEFTVLVSRLSPAPPPLPAAVPESTNSQPSFQSP